MDLNTMKPCNKFLLLILKITSKRWNQAQQNFSKMGLIKTPIRSTMSHERLNHCMIFPTHKEEVDKLKLKKLASDFVLNVPKRKNFFAVSE